MAVSTCSPDSLFSVELMSALSLSGESQLQGINKINLEYTDQIQQCIAELSAPGSEEHLSMNYVCAFLRTDEEYDIGRHSLSITLYLSESFIIVNFSCYMELSVLDLLFSSIIKLQKSSFFDLERFILKLFWKHCDFTVSMVTRYLTCFRYINWLRTCEFNC